MTFEEAKAQADRLERKAKKHFDEAAPKIQEDLKLLKTPIDFRDIVHIYQWLYRKQITLDMIPVDVLREFKESKQYEEFKRRSNEE
jgi:hypothetical protein